jgi:GMP synthase-like glutamine amidotransferase
MRVHYLQHVPFEGLGRMDALLESRGHSLSASRLFASPELPGLADFDALIAMGGPMSVNDEADYPWLAPEKRLVRESIGSGKPVLGVCLGAQLIASSLGSRVYRNAEKEIGWLPVEGIAPADPAMFRFPPSLTAFHWHGETFDLPPGASRLAASAGCANQAFQVGRRTIGLQFHLETTPESALALVENCESDITGGRFVQGRDAILAAGAEAYDGMAALLERLLDYLLGEL